MHQEPLPPEILEVHRRREAVRRDPRFKKDPALQRLSDDWRRQMEGQGYEVKDGPPGEPSAVRKKTKGT